jgi:hypothetical protein
MNPINKPLFVTALSLAIAVQGSFALQAPYLISTTAHGDSAVQLVWRNNDAATQGFMVQRKDSNAAVFNTIDSVKSTTQLSYLDKINIKPVTLYTYQIRAYNSSSVSDTSNSLQATTATQVAIFKKPGFSVSWNSDTTNFARLVIYDSSNYETGYRIYRANGFSSSFMLLSQIVSTNPAKNDSIVWIDSTLTLNSWFNYKVAAFTATDSLFSDPCSTYSFHSEQIAQPVTFTKLSDFPISMDSGLSALAGDSLILKEHLSPTGKYTAINIKDPAHPNFDGYVDSTALLSYPVKTLLPVFLKYGVVNSFARKKVCLYNEKILVLQDSTLRRYQVQNNSLVMFDSLKSFKGNSILLLDTTILAVQYEVVVSTSFIVEHYFYPVQVSPAGFSLLPECYLGRTGGNSTLNYVIGVNFLRVLNNNMIISVSWWSTGMAHGIYPTYVIVYDISTNRNINLPDVTSYVNGSNTGNYISATENLSTTTNLTAYGYTTTATGLFVSDVRNLHSYEFASSHNGIYQDTVHKKSQLQNILLDTAGRKVYLVFSTNLTILSYQRENIGVRYFTNKTAPSRGIAICPGTFGTTIVLPDNCRNADLFIYDVAGRVVVRMRNITSNAVLFRPKSKSENCYIAVVRNDGTQYSAKFMTR